MSDSDEDAFPPSPAVSRRSSRIQLKSASWASWPTKKLLELLTQEGVPVEVGLSRADALQLADTALGEHLHAPLSPTFTPDAAAAGSAAATTTKPGKKRAGRLTTSGPGKRARKAGNFGPRDPHHHPQQIGPSPGSTHPRRVGPKPRRQDGCCRNTRPHSRTGPGPPPAVVHRHGAFFFPATIRLGSLRLHRLCTWHVLWYHGYCSPRGSAFPVFSRYCSTSPAPG